MQQSIDSAFDANAVGRRDEFAICDQMKLMGVGDDPLRIGRSDVAANPYDAGAQACCVLQLAPSVIWAELSLMVPFAQFRRPAGLADEQAPVVCRSDRIKKID